MTPELRDTCFDRNVERSLVGLSVLDDPLAITILIILILKIIGGGMTPEL